LSQPTGRACCPSVFDDGHLGFAVGAELRGREHLGLVDVAKNLKQPILWVLVVGTVGRVWEHKVAVLVFANLAAFARINTRSATTGQGERGDVPMKTLLPVNPSPKAFLLICMKAQSTVCAAGSSEERLMRSA